MGFTYIWLLGDNALQDFCKRRYGGEQPVFTGTFGHVGGATIELTYKLSEDGYRLCYLLYMETPNGECSYNDIQKIEKWTYEQIRADKRTIGK